MKKCEYLGCKKKAEVFSKTKAYCLDHAKELGLVRQTNLVKDYGFPETKNKLKLGKEKDKKPYDIWDMIK